MYMKKLLLSLFVLFAGLVQAQEKETPAEIKDLIFFGVDFSQAKVYGASESGYMFRDAFIGINTLFQREPKKYDTAKAFGKNVRNDIGVSLHLAEQINPDNLIVENLVDPLSEKDLADHIRQLNLGDVQGYGAILIADQLNKSTARATYNILIFRIDTREIISNKQVTTKAGGFGLRNYWASSVHAALKQARK